MVSDRFLTDGLAMSQRLGIYWPHLLMAMNLESGLRPDAGLSKPGHAIGLIQLEPENLPGVGWNGTREAFGQLPDFAQLPYVENFLAPHASQNLDSEGRIHQVLYVPATLTRPDAFPDSPDTVITASSSQSFRLPDVPFKHALISAYNSNPGFDHDRKGYITVGDLEATDIAAATPASSPFQKAMARLMVIAPDAVTADVLNVEGASSSSALAGGGIGGVPWMAVGVLMALGVGGTMLLAEKRVVKLPRWAPKWMRPART